MTFLDKIKDAVQGEVSQSDLAAAARLIESRRQKRLRLGDGKKQILRRNGPCLMCSHEMEYSAKLTPAHQNYGNDWLDRFLSEWKRPVEIGQGRYDRDMTINGRAAQVYGPYVCADCKAMARRIFHEKFPPQEPEPVDPERELFMRFQDLTLSHEDRWKALQEIDWDERFIALLRDTPYELFLSSAYWLLVKTEKLLRSGGRCEVCDSTQRLHTHHKSYEHHGEEHNYLNDLQILCNVCHANVHSVAPQ